MNKLVPEMWVEIKDEESTATQDARAGPSTATQQGSSANIDVTATATPLGTAQAPAINAPTPNLVGAVTAKSADS